MKNAGFFVVIVVVFTERFQETFWNCNFPMTRHVPSVCWLVGQSYFFKGRQIELMLERCSSFFSYQLMYLLWKYSGKESRNLLLASFSKWSIRANLELNTKCREWGWISNVKVAFYPVARSFMRFPDDTIIQHLITASSACCVPQLSSIPTAWIVVRATIIQNS